MSFPSLPFLTVTVVALLAGCGAKSKSEEYRYVMPREPQVVMSAFYKSETKSMSYWAQLHNADAYEQDDVSFFSDGTELVLADFDARRYELTRAPVESASTMPISQEFRSASPTITRNYDMHPVAVTAAPAVISLKDGFRVALSFEPLTGGEELEVVFTTNGGRVWAYNTRDSATLEGNELVVERDAKPTRYMRREKTPPPGTYELTVERSTFTNLYVRDILVSGGVRYQSGVTPVTITP